MFKFDNKSWDFLQMKDHMRKGVWVRMMDNEGDLVFYTSIAHDPVKVVFGSGEPSRGTDLTSTAWAEADNTDLGKII